jgi:tRNA dimethylallyltransferase
MVIILGPTATGKTSLSVKLAYDFDGEIISADSRQIYKGMDIGTGKDLDDYIIHNQQINYHLIDILNPNTNYSVYQFKKDYEQVYKTIINNNKKPFLCGGTGLYIESVLLDYQIMTAPPNFNLRDKLETYSLLQLIQELKKINSSIFDPKYHTSKRRVIRSIEILLYDNSTSINMNMQKTSTNKTLVIGIQIDRKRNLELIKKRLIFRLKNGMVEEVEHLLKTGLSSKRLHYFGLEYKFIGKYLSQELSYDEMVEQLNVAINRFSKRQMTFFRRMEKRGIKINWLKIKNYSDIKSLVNIHFNQ